MIVNDFDLVGIAAALGDVLPFGFFFTQWSDLPGEANTPLGIDADTMLSFSASFKHLQLIAGRDQQITQVQGVVEIEKFPPGRSLYLRRQLSRGNLPKYLAGFFIGKRDNHASILPRRVTPVKCEYRQA